MDKLTLVKEAIKARESAYTPYSKFNVGAAVLSGNDKVFLGCNIENASYGLTNCAERTAIFKAVSDKETEMKAIAIVADTDGPVSPCGACRQVIAEFANQDTKIYLANLNGDIQETTIEQLLPGYFTSKDMERS
ncbi:cytidine deaminase [Peribacillus loiseleuriae]|uniref:Cytidine deaminase n=1 Tax=Peribacillus loiseleuriae TaxID=1679170 RepID=A0A0K9GPI0_9BACI|nr:cytidine deaminase [Peribacillus loiseleuriae]KMY48481.1 cytidine deaminase [Peribacillus loiseleuriae]